MSSKRRLRRNQCGNKTKYSTNLEAHIVATRMARSKRQNIASYKCKFCKQYHVGRTPQFVQEILRSKGHLIN